MSLPTVENSLLQFQAGKADHRLVFWSLAAREDHDDPRRDEAEALLIRELTVRREISDDEARLLLNLALDEARGDGDPQALWDAVLDGSWAPQPG